MKKFVAFLGVVAAIVVGLAVTWNIYFPSATLRYKVTITVETPEGIKTGSAVREMTAYREPKIFPEQPAGHARTKGEAVVVDLGARGVVFGALGTDDYYVPLKAFGLNLSTDGVRQLQHFKSDKAVSLVEIKSSLSLVRFQNLNDPKSVEMAYSIQPDPNGSYVNPTYIITDNMAKLFGEGVVLKDVTVQIVNEPVTKGIVLKLLPWLPEYRNKMFDGQRYNTLGSQYPVANSLAAGAFTAGD
jgi:hypothetical protein